MKPATAFPAFMLGLLLAGLISPPSSAAEGDTTNEQAEASYLKLHPDFIVNLQASGDVHFLLATI